jgi:hypothetical protein
LLLQYRRQFADAARLYAEALETAPASTVGFRTFRRYNAACAGLLAAAELDEQSNAAQSNAAVEKSAWRTKAFAWLRAELDEMEAELETDDPDRGTTVRLKLANWYIDPDLVSVRGAAIPLLPQQEQRACLGLWNETNQLRYRANKIQYDKAMQHDLAKFLFGERKNN